MNKGFHELKPFNILGWFTQKYTDFYQLIFLIFHNHEVPGSIPDLATW